MDSNRLDWSLLRSFLAVIDAGSLLGASKRLGTYQPTLSRQIQELERQLGVPLFERTGRGLVPTAAALSMVDAARQMAAAAQDALAGLRVTAEATAGAVRLSASEVVSNYLLPASIAQLRQAFPRITVDISVSNQLSNLLRREADIALRMARPAQASLIARKVAQLPIAAYAATSYLARRGKPAKLAGLVKHDLLGLDQDDSLIRGLHAAGVNVSRDSFVVRTDNQLTYVKLIERGAGIGFIPQFVARQLPGVEAVSTGLAGASMPLWLVVHREIRANPLIRAVYDHLAASLPQQLVAHIGT